MSLLVFVHAAHEGPCVLGRILQDHGHKLCFVHLHQNQPVPPDLDLVDGLVIMGGPMNIDEIAEHPWLTEEMAYIRTAHQAGKPIVGICLGAQLIAAALGGEVKAMPQPEVGWHPLKLAFPGTTDPLLAGIPWNTMQFHLHGQEVTKLPPDALTLAGSTLCRQQAFRVGLTTYAFQYHFEWNKDDLTTVLGDPFITRTGHDPQVIQQDIAKHYTTYRRLGDRLSENITELLFPIDRR